MDATAAMDLEGAQRPPKRRHRAGGDRVEVYAGDTRFVAAASTLTSNSTYFASLLSANWRGNDDVGPRELFLDQDPAPFAILLAYMRRGSIAVDDITTDVLALAEFLCMEQFLLAVKVRWYQNIGRGRGPVLTDDDSIAAAFDEEHGCIRTAISSGLFPLFLKRDDVHAEKEMAVLTISELTHDNVQTQVITVDEAGQTGMEHGAMCLIGALNGMHLKGYTKREPQMDKSNRYEEITVFSRRKHPTVPSGRATDIFIPGNDEVNERREHCDVKQFAMLLEETDTWDENIIAPSEFSPHVDDQSDPFATCTFEGRSNWMEIHGFIARETDYEIMFAPYAQSLLAQFYPDSKKDSFRRCRMYSRRIPRPTKM
ncbi:hypothetical protein ACHAXT_001360 [Thalassiosira profunda]